VIQTEAHLSQHNYLLGGKVATCFTCYKAIMSGLMIDLQEPGNNANTLPSNKQAVMT
jgi:hypothetical protein